jgi:hypothetical protein
METKKINKEETIMNIITECKKKKGITIDINAFNERLKVPDELEFIKEAANLMGAKIVYD